MTCPEPDRIHAYFDGEFDAPSAAQIERHAETCADCRALLQDLQTTRSALRSLMPRAAPGDLRARLMIALDEEAKSPPAPTFTAVRPAWRTRTFWLGAFGGMSGTALAASLVFFLLIPMLNHSMLDDLVAAHLNSLMPDRLVTVLSTDHHTVKPWFSGHADVSPVVADFAAQGYRLTGGRADRLDGQRSAVVVYQHGAHIINVFSWVDHRHSLPANSTRKGYHIACWPESDLEYCAVSDTGWDELHGLVSSLQDLGRKDARE
jgi:anti-sigma factor RsiW